MSTSESIWTSEHFSVFHTEDIDFCVQSRWFSGQAKVRTYQIDELLGTKLRALYQRKKGRDLFDLSKGLDLDTTTPDRIVTAFFGYMEHDGKSVSRAEFEANLNSKVEDPAFMHDVLPLLAYGKSWDLEGAAKNIQDELVSRLPGKSWKGL